MESGEGRRSKNIEKLLEAGFTNIGDLPQPYHAVVAGLSEQEVDTIVSVKRRLDAERDYGRKFADVEDYEAYFVPF